VNGRHVRDMSWPLHEVGALLEARSIHPGRSARAHLQMLAETNSIPRARVGEMLEIFAHVRQPPAVLLVIGSVLLVKRDA
jgi:hypothetical protein